MSEQRYNINRVADRIGGMVADFITQRGYGGTFRAKDLHDYVGNITAPASADRILRLLRQQGILGYEVLNRSQSLYLVTRVPS